MKLPRNLFFIKTEIENQLNKKIKVLRSDRGGEYESPFFHFSCRAHHTHHLNQQTICHAQRFESIGLECSFVDLSFSFP